MWLTEMPLRHQSERSRQRSASCEQGVVRHQLHRISEERSDPLADHGKGGQSQLQRRASESEETKRRGVIRETEAAAERVVNARCTRAMLNCVMRKCRAYPAAEATDMGCMV